MLDPRIEAVRSKYDLSRDDFWELPQKKGAWLVKHAALEVVAVKAGIIFDNPVIIEADGANGIAALSVAGSLGDRREWATGEASPKNNRNAYPWAMAEKRAKDRVTLKLAGIHGLVYSEDEMPDPESDGTLPKAKTRDLYAEMRDELNACRTLGDLAILWNSPAFKAEFAKLKPDWKENLTAHKDELKAQFTTAMANRPPNFDNLEQVQE